MTITKRPNCKLFLIKSFFIFTVCTLFTSAKLPEEKIKQHTVKEFGAIPDDNKDDAQALCKALIYCKIHPFVVLKFEPGVYNFRDERAVELMNGIFEGKVKGNTQDSIFRPYYPYAKGLDFNGLKHVTIEAEGATLLFDGFGEPVSLNHCSDICIKGLTIDHKTKPHIEGTIIDVSSDFYDVEIDSLYRITSKMPLTRILYYSNLLHRILPREDYLPRFEIIDRHKIRIFQTIDPSMKANRIMASHTFHFRPAILVLEAKNINLDHVTIHSQPGMGIVGHRSENITMNGCRIVPLAGQAMSTNTDATHFTSCKGFIHYHNCQFEGHGDDAVNIHNYYLSIQHADKPNEFNLTLQGADWHAQVMDFPDVGNSMELVDKKTLAVIRKITVKSVENDITNRTSKVTFFQSLPGDIQNYYLIDITRLPKVEIIGCTVTSNRARGFLIKTRNVLIENNLIRESTGTGIHVAAEGSWHEGPISENVIIRYNHIVRCGSGAGNVQNASGIAVNVEGTKSDTLARHKHLVIEGNIIEGENSENGVYINGCEDATVRYNEISGCRNALKIYNTKKVIEN